MKKTELHYLNSPIEHYYNKNQYQISQKDLK